jgi:hypothetical protein
MCNCHRLRLETGIVAILLLCACGCGPGHAPTAVVEGKVLLKGKPLEFGAIAFMPDNGPIARGTVQSDGTFTLTTYSKNDGAVLGMHRVRIGCYEAQKPGFKMPKVEDFGLGKSLIPEKYTKAETSGIKVEVKKQNEPFVIKLK